MEIIFTNITSWNRSLCKAIRFSPARYPRLQHRSLALSLLLCLFPSLLPAAPDQIVQEVSLGDQTLTMRLTRLDLRGSGFDFRLQQPDGSIRRLRSVPERSYLGGVDDRPGAVSCGIQRDDGTFKGAILFERGATWYTQDSSVTRTQALEYQNFSDYRFPTGSSVTPALGGSQLHGFDLAIDLSNAYYNQIGADPALALERVEFSVNLLRAIYMRDALIRPYLSRVILRAVLSQDPYNGSQNWFNMASRGRTEWSINQSDSARQLVAVVGGGGFNNGWSWFGSVGTDNGYSAVQSGSAGEFDNALRRQIGFNWNSVNSAGGNPEGLGIMGSGGPARISGSENYLILNYRNQRASAGVITRESRFDEVELPPYASMDTVQIPRSMIGSVLVSENHPIRVSVPLRDIGNVWHGGNEATFDDDEWQIGINGVGYERGNGNNAIRYDSYIRTNLSSQMASNTSCFIRIPFRINDPEFTEWNRLILRMRYDDGFIAYLNGREVSSANAPSNPTNRSAATTFVSDNSAILFQDFNLTDHLDLLQEGDNILAIHGLNESTGSSDFLIQAKLLAGVDSAEPAAPLIISPLTNDHDANSQRLTLASFDPVGTGGGTATQLGSRIVYTASPNFAGTDWLHYTAADSTGKTAQGVILIDGVPVLENLDLTPAARSISAAGGSFELDVESRGGWNWRRMTETATWLSSSEPLNQSRVQLFTYSATPNTSPSPRSADLIFTDGDTIRTHTVTQEGNPDVHGDTAETATLINLTSPIVANLDLQGDVDFYRLEIESNSLLTVESSGQTDTLGSLFDSSGRILVQNNNANGLNFRITYRADPGTYFLRVRHPLNRGTGEYTLIGGLTFIPSLAIQSSDTTTEETTVNLIFTSIPGESYRVESSRDLREWQEVMGPIIAEGNTVEESLTFNNESTPKLFLRVRQE